MNSRAQYRIRCGNALMTCVVLCLSAWLSGCGQSARPGGGAVANKSGDIKELEAFLNSYFKTWSDQDMVAYKAHFDASAVVMYVEDGEVKSAKRLEPFISSQAEVHKQSRVRLVERMLRYESQVDEKAASVTVWWELTRDGGAGKTGVDRFVLIKAEAGWAIASLVFYQD